MGIAERKTRQKQALRERILDAARHIVMREGFAALSMRKIADAIEYSPATLYLHFASRDEIAQALCAEGYAQLLKSFIPLVEIADPGERLKALGRAYVSFGVTHPETYRLIFMEDPSYTGAALGGGVHAASAAGAAGAVNAAEAETDADADASQNADRGTAALSIMLAAIEELKAAGRLPATLDAATWAESFWATLHGIVALNLTCPVFPSAPLDTIVDMSLDAWLGASPARSSLADAEAKGARKDAARKKASRSEPTPGEHADADSQPASEPAPEPAPEPALQPAKKTRSPNA